ncbi:Unknown protein [Striga hermonthica]|uniref:Uncharacterized protein n=1 Tax=Striga hermonthica TaxID=68872 RepID=A0A9N7N7W6_STRHE|nr:Unknown protein [Striga hermonthica]
MVDSQSPPIPLILSPCSSGRRSSCDSKSPEFEFWMVRNRVNFPQPDLLSADELFSDGFILPLRLLDVSNDPPPPQAEAATEDCDGIGPDRAPDPEPLTVNELPATSKRWGNIFHKIREKRGLDSSPGGGSGGGGEDRSTKEKDLVGCVKEKRRDQKKVSGGGGVAAAAELNINIWPFSRSRSAGNGGNRPRSAANRKVSSAPCSRSNSTGESKLRKWPPNSPSRGGGVHLGRTSPVLQIRRGGGSGAGRRTEAYLSGEGGGKGEGSEGRRKVKAPPSRGRGVSRGRVLSLNVPMCIGYRHNLSCKSDENSALGVAAAAAADAGGQAGGAVAGEGARRGHLFNIKSLFTKKVY